MPKDFCLWTDLEPLDGSQNETAIFLKTLNVNTMVTNPAGKIILAKTIFVVAMGHGSRYNYGWFCLIGQCVKAKLKQSFVNIWRRRISIEWHSQAGFPGIGIGTLSGSKWLQTITYCQCIVQSYYYVFDSYLSLSLTGLNLSDHWISISYSLPEYH